MKIQVEQKQPVSSYMQALCAWPKKYVQKNSKHFFEFCAPEIQIHRRWSLGIWLLSLLTLEKWQELKQVAHTPLRCLVRLALDWWCLLFFDKNRDSEMILPKYITLLHGTTSQGASRILAEDLIRPGDFSMHQDHLLRSDFPTYGHCSMGRQAADPTLSPLQVKHLTKMILRTNQGSMAAFVYGIYTGLHPHQNHRVDSNDEAQVLCGKYGIARGLQNTTEHTTVSAVILTYQHQVETRASTTRSTSLPSVKSSSNLSWLPMQGTFESTIHWPSHSWPGRKDDTIWGQQTSSSTWSWCESPMP